MSKLVYSGVYLNGCKVRTKIDGKEVELLVRDSEGNENTYYLGVNEATEITYALLKAIKELNDE